MQGKGPGPDCQLLKTCILNGVGDRDRQRREYSGAYVLLDTTLFQMQNKSLCMNIVKAHSKLFLAFCYNLLKKKKIQDKLVD